MAPTTTKPRETNFTDIGVAGRKTGITIKDTGQRDALGMEPLDGFFSPGVSPEKELTGPNSSPAKIGSNGGTISIDESMDIVTSEVPARIPSRASLPPRARSPIKTSLNTPARRASSVGLSSPAHTQAPTNRKLTFSKSGASSVPESSPALPPPLPPAARSSSVEPPQSRNTTEPNGSSAINTDKPQQKPGKQPLSQATEESISTSSPAEPLAKKAPAKRGLLMSKRPAKPKMMFSLDDTDSGSEEVGSVEREGVSVVSGDGGVVDEDTVIPETQEEVQEEEEVEEEAPVKKGRAAKQKAKAPPKKAAKATEKDPTLVKANNKAKGKKPVEPEPEPEPEPEQESEPAPAPPVKPARGKKAKASEPEPETEPAPVKSARAKKAPAKVPEPETELDRAPTKTTRGKRAAAKAAEPEPEPDPALVKTTRGKKTAAKAPEPGSESDPTLVKPTRGKRARAIKETEAESEPTPPVKPAKGKKAASKMLETETESEPPPKTKPVPKGRGSKVAKPIVESSPSEELEREPTPPPKPAAKPRGKGRAKPAEPEQEPTEQGDDQEEPPKKRTKTTKEKSAAKPSAKAKDKAPSKPQKAKALSQSFTQKSQHTKSSPLKPIILKKGGQRIIKQPPPPPRTTSEEPGAARRSTRAHIAPLEFWKGEKIMYGLTAQPKSSGTIALPTIMEVIRVESDSEAERGKAEKRRKKLTNAGAKRKRTKPGEEDEDDLQEEEWESRVVDGEIGVVRGYVKTYHEPSLDGKPDEEEIEERELAFSRNRIVTVEVANGDFTFVKTCTEDFFGTGMVEIPPGGIKRTKNSGKMHLVFYVISGKVEVKIGDNEFRVRKGAQFMVPRGNLYSIENPYDFQAKMFFAQGCEKVITAEAGSDDEDDEMEG